MKTDHIVDSQLWIDPRKGRETYLSMKFPLHSTRITEMKMMIKKKQRRKTFQPLLPSN
jgi:hypothetical protein